ncbi:hypothetical protein [Chryseolinea lacunae]|uniref:Uncharacterized protein n=1 Tax=Chryseolinea lacunae TaxID=2801331 RepID=A0ABS1KXM4_9BACT|nr:hypothetical protein [Chryseolinea lacunae]MBL0744209.1 hypothetical protein [Chryseolinea lacunae]
MALKIFKAFWFLSVVVVVIDVLYTYAGLPEHVVVKEEATGQITIGRDAFFYTAVAFIILVNALVYLIAKIQKHRPDFRTWFYGFMMAVNVFFVIALSFIALYNSSEKFDYSRIDFAIYGSVALIAVWAISWPVYSIYRKFSVKS